MSMLFRPHVARRLIAHPSALTTIGALLRRENATAAMPWWNERATRYLSQHLSPGARVFEWGSGASTVWLMNQGADVTSVEHNPEWHAKVLERCPAANVHLIPGTPDGQIRAARDYLPAQARLASLSRAPPARSAMRCPVARRRQLAHA
jgi:hypothetical protein